MAEKWQQWYPHDIDSWQGSANIQALTDAAYRAVHNLIQEMWKQTTCTLPNNDRELAKRSRMGERWPSVREEVVDYFHVLEDGSITHQVLLRKWIDARAIHESRKNAARKTNTGRSPHGHRDGQRTVTDAGAPRSADTVTKTKTGTNTQGQVQKPSRGKRESNPIHEVFKGLIFASWKEWHVPGMDEPPWDGAEGKQLGMLIGANPKLGPDGMRRLLQCRARSTGVNLAERPSKWLRTLTDYARGPLNQFKQPEGTNGSNQQNRGSKLDQQLAELEKAGVRIPDRGAEDRAGEVCDPARGGHGRDAPGVVLEGAR